MPLFNYTAIDESGATTSGSIDAINEEVAIRSLQRRGLVLSSIDEASQKSIFDIEITIFQRVKNKDVVILSRQIATLFEAQVSALRVFKLLAAETPNPALAQVLTQVADDLQGGSNISKALEQHPKVFSPFYVNMVRAGEEAGKLDETFSFLADYLDRTYEVSTKAKNALIYPAFVISTFVIVMILMLTLVIPRISAILVESGQEVPIYTKIVIGLSNFLVDWGLLLLALLIVAGGVAWWQVTQRGAGRLAIDRLKISIPYVGELYRKLYLSRIADNMSTMLESGISAVRALEVTADVVGNRVFEDILRDALEEVKAGKAVSTALAAYDDMPGILTQMIKVGEETGELGNILRTLSKFYRREVTNAVDTLVNLIEPIMIVVLGLGVGVLLASVLIPIYNISAGI